MTSTINLSIIFPVLNNAIEMSAFGTECNVITTFFSDYDDWFIPELNNLPAVFLHIFHSADFNIGDLYFLNSRRLEVFKYRVKKCTKPGDKSTTEKNIQEVTAFCFVRV